MSGYPSLSFILLIQIFCVVTACQTEGPPDLIHEESGVALLETYETILSVGETHPSALYIDSPSIVRYGGDSSLIVYDALHHVVAEFDGQGQLLNTFGQTGRGPGEYRYLANLVVYEDQIFLVDHWQFSIHQFDRQAILLSSMNYGRFISSNDMLSRLASMIPYSVQSLNIENQPFVMADRTVLIPSGRDGKLL
ncbi:MAG: 6-bladed beta-propeller [Balneolaceae bacterium]